MGLFNKCPCDTC